MSGPDSAPKFAGRGALGKLALSLVIAGGFVWLLERGALRLLPTEESLQKLDLWGVAGYLVIWVAMHFTRSARWYYLLAAVERVPLRIVVRVALIGYLAIALLPFRMGEAARPLMIRREGKLSAWAATGTVGAERLIDGLSISLLLLLALKLASPQDPLPDHIGDLPVPVKIVPGAAIAAAGTFALGCLVMGIFYWRRAWAERVTRAVLGIFSERFGRWFSTKVGETASGLGFLTEARYALPFLLGTAAYWLLNGLSWWVLAQACGLGSIGFLEAVATMGVVALAIVVPSTPGFFGAFQLSIYAGLAMYLPPAEVTGLGSSYAFFGYVLPIGLSVLAGLGAILVRPTSVAALAEPASERSA